MLNLTDRPCCERHRDAGTPRRCFEVRPEDKEHFTQQPEYIAFQRSLFRTYTPAFIKDME